MHHQGGTKKDQKNAYGAMAYKNYAGKKKKERGRVGKGEGKKI